MVVRVTKYGWGQGVFQLQCFAVGTQLYVWYVLYITLLLQSHLGSAPEAGMPWLVAIQDGIVAWGQYVVLFFLAAEVTIFLVRSAGLRVAGADGGRETRGRCAERLALN